MGGPVGGDGASCQLERARKPSLVQKVLPPQLRLTSDFERVEEAAAGPCVEFREPRVFGTGCLDCEQSIEDLAVRAVHGDRSTCERHDRAFATTDHARLV